MHPTIKITTAQTNNLKNLSLSLPRQKLIAVTGISGSGKSSLVFELIAKEGQRRYFETLPAFARQFAGKLNRPEVESIEGLSPVIAVGQRTGGGHARSTVGTLSDIYDLLRLLYARAGKTSENVKLSRALFSFNSPVGKCPQCNGIGKREEIDLRKLIVFPEKTIREGALAPTLPTGYIMYSQVTIDVLNRVCEAEGFNVDIPWRDLTEAQQKVILYGSEKIKVPFGKHSLESRLKWTGIKAKPREEGFYKGMIPIMSDILRRDRNANILKYVHAVTCPACAGTRLNDTARSVRIDGKSIAEIVTFEVRELRTWTETVTRQGAAAEIVKKIAAQLDLLIDLGLGHLTLDRPAQSLRASEIQRIRVANQLLVPLSDVLYVFDEPSIGLHPAENARLVFHLKRLVKKGNTVIVVEHDLNTIRAADHLLELGPGAGIDGGEILFNGAFAEFIEQTDLAEVSPTFRAITAAPKETQRVTKPPRLSNPDPAEREKSLRLINCYARNLKHLDVDFLLGKLNVVSGKSGAGKAALVRETLLPAVRRHLNQPVDRPVKITRCENLDAIDKLIFIDRSPIGKTPRSNPATYLGLSDYIRDIFAAQPAAKAARFTKSRFSFNNKGGRCETCQGAGKIQIGMHFLGNVDLVCGTCHGKRFNEATLQIKYKNKSIADVYEMSIDEAVTFFTDDKKVLHGLKILHEIGLGYLTLGQSSTTLSGGEGQRIKIANQLQKKDTGDTLYVILEPSIGLHRDNIQSLLQLFDRIKQRGNTIVCIEQDETVIAHCDRHVELGPEGGKNGGYIINRGAPQPPVFQSLPTENAEIEVDNSAIMLNGITTHNLKNVDVRIPKNQLTVVTGLSGSGKSSLVYDTIFAEANARFTESLSTYHRTFLQQNSAAQIKSFAGLSPAIGINRRGGKPSPRSTVGTLTGIYAALRLLYARIAQQNGADFTAQHFSFNHHAGACPDCAGLGRQRRCDPDKVIVSPEKPMLNGATSDNKALAYYADAEGQFAAILREVARQKEFDLNQPWQDLPPEIQHLTLYGTGEKIWETTWHFTAKSRTGTQEIKAVWRGLCGYIDEEYGRKRNNKNIAYLEAMLHEVTCPTCHGSRLKPELLHTTFLEKNIHELTQLSISESLNFLQNTDNQTDKTISAISQAVLPGVIKSLQTLGELGLGYLTLDRAAATLSGGERQRVTLAGQLANHLFGVIYVLDEPTVGLDKAQISALLKILRKLIAAGNTVIVTEHDAGFIRSADYLIETGPGAGTAGGEIIFQGKIVDIFRVKESVTARMLEAVGNSGFAAEEVVRKSSVTPKIRNAESSSDSGIRGLKTNSAARLQPPPPLPTEVRDRLNRGNPAGSDSGAALADRSFGVKGAFANNLKNIDVNFTAKTMTAITGVSGSGKSSLIKEVLHKSQQQKRAVNCEEIYGLEQFAEVLLIDQTAATQSRLSTPASYTKILDDLKMLFAKTEAARERGLKKADFSYQSKNGKCPHCGGRGAVKTSMDFMSDVWLTCDVCRGLRYSAAVLAVRFRGRSIGEILQMTVSEAITFFEPGKIVEKLQLLQRVGIGHLQLGQAGNTLSGGESQRLKLAKAMSEKRKGATLYLFDEPSTGLHYFDILQLIEVFQGLIERGDTVIFIEHHAVLVEAANEVVRLGPGSGESGGFVVA